MELSKFLRDHSRTIKGKEQMLMNAYAKALEVSFPILYENTVSCNKGYGMKFILEC